LVIGHLSLVTGHWSKRRDQGKQNSKQEAPEHRIPLFVICNSHLLTFSLSHLLLFPRGLRGCFFKFPVQHDSGDKTDDAHELGDR